MIDYLKGSIVKFKLNFENDFKNDFESIWRWQISIKILVCLERGKLTIVKLSFPRITMDTLLPIFIKGCTVGI